MTNTVWNSSPFARWNVRSSTRVVAGRGVVAQRGREVREESVDRRVRALAVGVLVAEPHDGIDVLAPLLTGVGRRGFADERLQVRGERRVAVT